jgi:hypothetical protein
MGDVQEILDLIQWNFDHLKDEGAYGRDHVKWFVDNRRAVVTTCLEQIVGVMLFRLTDASHMAASDYLHNLPADSGNVIYVDIIVEKLNPIPCYFEFITSEVGLMDRVAFCRWDGKLREYSYERAWELFDSGYTKLQKG